MMNTMSMALSPPSSACATLYSRFHFRKIGDVEWPRQNPRLHHTARACSARRSNAGCGKWRRHSMARARHR
jgi:hypothetical protein